MQRNSPESHHQDVKPGTEPPGPTENLALLYQSLLTGIIRLKGQRQHIPDSETFRKRTKATLQDVERVAVATGYDVRDVTRYPLCRGGVPRFGNTQLERSCAGGMGKKDRFRRSYSDKTDAGLVFFEKLDQFRSRRDSEQLADILEVYLLCLLLGFEGRYSGAQRGELEGITDSLRMRIEYVRGRDDHISPSGKPAARVGACGDSQVAGKTISGC